MSTFLFGNSLNAAIENIFREATDKLVLISPYIKLHERLKSSLLNHIKKDKLQIVIVFGKNDDDFSKSMSIDDIEFFKQFPNVEIRHEKRLHAKYYANNNSAIITSMNLYSYSQDNNIEVGILMETKILGNSLDSEAYNYFTEEVIEQSTVIFKKTPNYESSMAGIIKKYTGSTIKIDDTSKVIINKKGEYKQDSSTSKQTGYCIRTSVKIPFNTDRPLCDEAYKSWKKYEDKNYSEKYCHFSGEPSNGQTSFSKPILQKNWRKAKETFNF
jgi:hypothetical protein